MKTKIVLILTTILTFSLLSVAQASSSQDSTVIRSGGRLVGKGRVIVTWCKQGSISFDLTIEKDGTVSGKVGDATIKNGRLRKRSFLMRWLGNREYAIWADLDGFIVEAEHIRRKSIILMLDFKDGRIKGAMNTSGSQFGGKNKMFMTVVDITLKRTK